MKGKEDIINKIQELLQREGAFGSQMSFDCGYDSWSEEVTDYDKIEDLLFEFASFISGEEIKKPVPEIEPKQDALVYQCIPSINQIFHFQTCP